MTGPLDRDAEPGPGRAAAAAPPLPRLERSRRACLVALGLTAAALAAGVLLATLPLGTMLMLPATALVVGGLIGVPVAARSLLVAHREVVAAEVAAHERIPPSHG